MGKKTKTAVEQELEAFKGLKGKARKEAITAFLAEKLTPEMFSEFLREAPARAIKSLATHLFITDRPDLYRATYAEGVRTRTDLGNLMPLYIPGKVRPKDPEEMTRLYEEFPGDEVTCMVDHGTIDHMRRVLAAGGAQHERFPAAEVEALEGWPGELGFTLAKALRAKGVTWREKPAAPSKIYRVGHDYWTDEQVAELALEGGAGTVVSGADFTTWLFTGDVSPFGTQTFEVSLGGGEWVDVEANGDRVVLAPIFHAREAQYDFSVQVDDPAPDPYVWSIDHDGTGPSRTYTRLSSFLRKLAPASN